MRKVSSKTINTCHEILKVYIIVWNSLRRVFNCFRSYLNLFFYPFFHHFESNFWFRPHKGRHLFHFIESKISHSFRSSKISFRKSAPCFIEIVHWLRIKGNSLTHNEVFNSFSLAIEASDNFLIFLWISKNSFTPILYSK